VIVVGTRQARHVAERAVGRYSRDETEAARLDRNYAEMLQELRVAETGVQILFAFLLTIAFQQRFSSVSTFQRGVYVATLICAATAAVLFIAPVAAHRMLFRQRRKDELVAITGRFAAAGLVFLLLSVLGSILLILDFVSGPVPAGIVTGALGCLSVWLWYFVPKRLRRPLRSTQQDDHHS
jgi:hypothetical protein